MVVLRCVKKIFILCALVLVSATGIAAWYVHRFLVTPGPALRQPAVIFVAKGASLRTISRMLAEEGLVNNGTLFSLWARWIGADRSLLVLRGAYQTGSDPLVWGPWAPHPRPPDLTGARAHRFVQ